MRLAHLTVRNVRSFASASLPLGDGTTLLVGDVGAGKTSLLYAVEMALFGFAEVDAGYLVRHGAHDAEVGLRLEDGEHTYDFRRRFRRRTVRGKESFQLDTSTLTVDGATQTYSATELRRRAIELLGFPDNPNPNAHSDLWRWAVYVPQERMRAVLDDDPAGRASRLETIRKALGLESYRTAAESAGAVALELGRRAERWDAEAQGLAHYEDDLARWREAGDAARAESTALTEAIDRDEATLRVLDAEIARRERAATEFNALEGRIEQATGAVETATANRSRSEARNAELAHRMDAVGGTLEREVPVRSELAEIDRRHRPPARGGRPPSRSHGPDPARRGRARRGRRRRPDRRRRASS